MPRVNSIHRVPGLVALLLAAALPLPATASPLYVDVAQFGKAPAWNATATEERTETNWQRPHQQQAYHIPLVSIIDRALNPAVCKFPIHKSGNGRWVPVQATFKAADHSFATSGFPLIGRIIGAIPCDFTVELSADGVITGRQSATITNLVGAGLGYPMGGSVVVVATENLNLNTGQDDWQFEAKLDGRYNVTRGPFAPPVSGSLTAKASAQRAFKVVAAIEDSGTAGDAAGAAAAGGDRSFQIESVAFRNSAGEPRLRFNDEGVLAVAIVNHTGLDLADLQGRVTIAENDTGILNADKLGGSFRVAREARLDLPVDIKTTYAVPATDLHFVVTFTYHKILLGQQTLVVPAESFYRNTAVAAPDYGSPRIKAVARYFGLAGTPYGDPAKELTGMAAQGDALAAMWEAIFYSLGAGGYKFDPDKAYHAGRAAVRKVEERARDGDPEALYLLFYACELGVEGENAHQAGSQFLERSASAGFLPARYDRARELNYKGDYAAGARELVAVYDAGVQKAATVIGIMAEKGFGGDRDPDRALTWYNKGAAFGDPEAFLCQANLAAAGFGDTPPDAAKAMELAGKAAAKGCSAGLIFIGNAELSGRMGIAQDLPAAIKSFKAAADEGDRQAMLALGETYLTTQPGFPTDEHAALFWIRKAAERESPKAMLILAKYYNEGTLVEKNLIAGRYWYNQAAIHGYVAPDRQGVAATQQTFLDFWKYADFSPSYVYVNEYGRTVGDSGDSMLNGLFSGLFGAMTSYYGNQQQMIDGVEYIGKRSGRKIYGGTVSSHFVSTLQLKAGQTVAIRSYGVISTGMMSGLADADGLGPNWPEYRIVPSIPCSAVMARVADGPWQLAGKHAKYRVPKDGPLSLALNAIDYRNYKGYFDLVIEVPEDE
jgi:TPR repeat protein